MQSTSLGRSNFAQTAVVSLVTFAALALLGLVLAYWTWAWLGTRPEPRAQAAVQAGGRVEAAYGLFGSAQRDRNGAAPAARGGSYRSRYPGAQRGSRIACVAAEERSREFRPANQQMISASLADSAYEAQFMKRYRLP